MRYRHNYSICCNSISHRAIHDSIHRTQRFRFRSASYLRLSTLVLAIDSHSGYSVCTIRCNIGCGLGSFLSMVTSHLLAVPNTESTNCYNLWLVCLRHLQPPCSSLPLLLNPGFVSAFGLRTSTSFLRLRHKSSPTTLVLPCAIL